MTTLYFTRGDVDFDDVFERDPAGISIPGYNDEFDTPLLYASLEFGTKAPDVEYEHPDFPHLDITNFWAAKGSVNYVNPGALPDFIEDVQVGGPPSVTASVNFFLLRNGTSTWSPSLAGTNFWISPQGPVVGDDYDVRFTQTAGNAQGTLTGVLGEWLRLNEARGMLLSKVQTSVGAVRARRTILVEIRRRSDGVPLYSQSVVMEAEADIS